ncbi:hypothetical protein TNCV_4029571 [Trichonephila clavipes]|nr:hypothetical protein TNCV_4029571 [Trichonephila clavipes]
MALGLKMLHFDNFLDNIEYNFLKEQVIDDLLHYQEVIDSHSSMPIELPNKVLSRVLSAYQKFVEKTRQDNLNKVDETHPGLKNDFMNGCFGIKRTDKPFSSIPIDVTLETTINAEAARCLSGIAHFTNSLAARQRWTKSHSIRAIVISYVLDVCGLKQLQDVSADLQPIRIKIYGKQLSDFNEIFENNINPFDESLDKDSLYNIATAKPVPENVENILLNLEKNESLSCDEHEADTPIIYHICQISVDAQVVRCSDSDILIIFLGNLDHLNASLKLWIQWGVGNLERLISINDLYQGLCISLSKALSCFHAITGCDYTPAFFRKGKLRPFKLLEKSVEYQLVCQEIITDDDDELERIFAATLEKFICHMYGVPNSSNVNDVRFYLFSKTYQSKKFDDNFEKK